MDSLARRAPSRARGVITSRELMTLETDSQDVLDEAVVSRLCVDVEAALKRKPAQEARLAGVLRVLLPFSRELRARLAPALDTMIRRGSYERGLYAALVRSLAESEQEGIQELLVRALSAEEGGGLATLSAACCVRSAALSEPLARAAMSRHAHVAFAGEVARLCRGESNGSAVASIAPKIKESHRIALCVELLAPLLHRSPPPAGIVAALNVLRDAERHLGRWLVLAELATRAGDSTCLAEAKERAGTGSESARSAWALVAWALAPDAAPPSVRPTLELVARLSDRPSADKDTTFLFRLASARAPAARPLLESLAKGTPLGDECAVRAQLHLARDFAFERAAESLQRTASTPRKDVLRALAAAALHDIGQNAAAQAAAEELKHSRNVAAACWAALVHAAANSSPFAPIVDELRFRRVHLGWIE